MSNTLLTVSYITKAAVTMFRNTNAFLQLIDRQYDDEYKNKDFKIGSTLRIRLPVDYVLGTGATVTPQASVETQTTLAVSNQYNVTTSFSSADFALSIDDFSNRFLKKMVNNLAAGVASNVMSLANGVPNLVQNVNGSNAMISPNASTWLAAGAQLDLWSALRDGERKAILDPLTQARTVSSLAGLFNPTTEIGNQYRTGAMGGTNGVLGIDDWRLDQTVLGFTSGSASPTAISGASQTGSSITVATISGTLVAGDIITLPGCEMVNPLTKESNGQLMQFVITQATTNGTTLHVYPPVTPVSAQGITNTVQYANVTASPTNGQDWAQVVPASTSYRKNLVFRHEAFALVCADLPLIRNGVVKSARESYDGISLRMVEGYDVYNDLFVDRMDILFGTCSPRPAWAVIVADVI